MALLGKMGILNVHVSSADGGSVILVANNTTVARVTKTTADFYSTDVTNSR